ncbi:MAG: hypothetical protein ABUR63_00995, partial [Verrucomicrobiota bacterium]
MPRRAALAACLALLSTTAARAESAAPLVHPIFAHLPDAPEDDRARQEFTTAASHYNLRPVEVVDVPAPAAPRGPDQARLGILNAQKMAFTEAKKDLDAAATEAASTGGAGFSTADLADLYLHRAMATARADWKAQAAAPATDERTRAFDDYLRAATLMPDQAPNARQLPPQALADLQRALDIVHKRARGTLVVKGPADALIALDGGALQPLGGGVTFKDLRFGEHLLRVEQIGFGPWGTAIPFGQPEMDIDVPARPPLALDAATAAAHARRMGARYALVATPKGGPGAPVELSLVDSATAAPRDAALVATAREPGQMDAAVMRLDEEARRFTLEQQQNGGVAAPVAPIAAADGAA